MEKSMVCLSPSLGSPKVLKPLRNEILAEIASTCTALCCCPLAIIYVILLGFVGYPCSLAIKHFRRAKTRYQITNIIRRIRKCSGEQVKLHLEKEGESQSNGLKKPVKLLFRFVMHIGGETMAGHGNLNCCILQFPPRIREKIAQLKKMNLRKWAIVTIPKSEMYEELESPASASSPWSPGLDSRGSERSPEIGSGFDHPFWQEHFERGQLGFWRGLSIKECRICSKFRERTEYFQSEQWRRGEDLGRVQIL
eukprot:Gb_10138 [translate_table: standard]